MKLPNGYGSVSKITNRRLRKPWCVRVTTKFVEEDGVMKQKRKLLGYFETKADALAALSKYNENKYNIEYSKITFSECWKMWQNDKAVLNLAESTLKGYEFVFKQISDEIKESKISDLKLKDYQKFFNNYGKSYNTKRKIKNTIKLMYDYLIKNEYITNNNPIALVDIGKSGRAGQAVIFTDEEIEKIWEAYNETNNEYVGTVLILIYSGMRINELLQLKTKDVHYDEEYIQILDSKTEAGDRKVPIANKIKPLVKHWMDYDFEYLISINKLMKKGTYKRSKMTYANYRDSYWDQIIDKLNLNKELTPHNSRKTCVSLLTRSGVQATLIKLIVGHEGALDLTEKVYTHVDIKQLIDAINKI